MSCGTRGRGAAERSCVEAGGALLDPQCGVDEVSTHRMQLGRGVWCRDVVCGAACGARLGRRGEGGRGLDRNGASFFGSRFLERGQADDRL